MPSKTVLKLIASVLLFASIFQSATAVSLDDNDEAFDMMSDDFREARFWSNDTTTSLLLAATLGVITLIGLAVISTYLTSSASNRDYQYQYQPQRPGHHGGNYYEPQQFQRYRSDDGATEMDTGAILKWIQVLTEMYKEFNLRDMDCQKKHFCEALQDQKIFHTESLGKAMEYAKYLEVVELPEEVRSLLDEMVDSFEVSKGTKECGEYFYCQNSLTETYKRTFWGNELN